MGAVSRRPSAVLAILAVAVAGCDASGAEDRVRRVVESRRIEPSGPPEAVALTPALVPIPLDGDMVAVPVERYTPMWEEPGSSDGADFALDTRNPHGELAPLLVDDAVLVNGSAWYEVLLPLRPNGTTAWVRAADVTVRERTQRIEVDLSERTLWHYEGDELLHRFRVGVGTAATPTGTGRFFVWVKVLYADAGGPYGSAALGLSGFSPVLSDWPSEGRMAVHGTADPDDRGRAVSHGCVRVFNDDLQALVGVPLGTPVVIRA
jgi:lipoprotein-anchoring transpeptidase ErfK/SrfK